MSGQDAQPCLLLAHRSAAPVVGHGPAQPAEESLCLTGMLAGGTGITPMYQTARVILKDPKDATRLSLIYGNLSEKDILIKDLLDELTQSYPDRSVHLQPSICCACVPILGQQWTLRAGLSNCAVVCKHLTA